MNKFVSMLILLSSWGLFANQPIDDALQAAISNGCMSNRRVANQVEEWGVPGGLFSEPSFTNLVGVMQHEIVGCDLEYINSLTGIVKRSVFVAALTKCGTSTYHDSVVRWFGSTNVLLAANSNIMDSFIRPIATEMEDYMDMNFDAMGISNVLNNAKSVYNAASNSVEAAAIEWTLSGQSKASKLEDLRNGLIDRIRDGSLTR